MPAMLPTLRKRPACARNQFSRGARPVMFVALAAAVFVTPTCATAQRNKLPQGITAHATTSQAAVPATTASVLTYHNDNQRTGVNPNETAFIPTGPNANLNAQTFGKIWSRPVDGTIYAQPLFVPSVQLPNVPDVLNSTSKNGVYNVVFVCTTHNSVYAFDAGGSAQITRPTSTSTAVRSAPLWRANFNFQNQQVGPVPISDLFTEDLTPEIGIVGTPVIDCQTDPATGFKKGTLYVVAKTKEGKDYAQRLHAIDITTGAERTDIGSPLLISATVPGTGDGSVLDANNVPVVNFDPLWENQQAALTLVNAGTPNATILVAWGSHGDNGPFHGWVMSFSAAQLALTGVYNTSPNGDSGSIPDPAYAAGAGIWQGGAGPAVDENGDIFIATGAGIFNADPSILSGGTEYGNSVLKLHLPFAAGGPGPVLDYFAPSNWEVLSQTGQDLGSGGVLVLPDVGNTLTPRLAVAVGTEGKIYLLNRDTGALGHFNFTLDSAVETLPDAVGPVYGMPAFFNNTLYVQGTGDVLKAIPFQNGFLSAKPSSTSQKKSGFPGSSPTVTTTPTGTNATVWTLERFTPPAILPGFGVPDPTPVSVLHAYDAANLSNEVLSALTMGTRDVASSSVFTPPTVVNSRVYTGGVGELVTYGYFAANGVTPKSNEADHFVITGPRSVGQKTGNWYSITAIGVDGAPIKLSGTVHLSYRIFRGPTVNITTLSFNGQSNLLFQYAFMQPGTFEFYANDDDGHSTYVPDIDLMPSNTLFPEISVNGPNANGPDHLIVKAPTQAKVGSKVSLQVTVVTPTNAAFTWQLNGANFFRPNVSVSLTLPNGTQGAIAGAPIYAYSAQGTVPFKVGSSAATLQVTVPSPGNHVIVVSGTVSLFFGTDPANPTTTISYPVTGTATIVGVP